MSGDDSAAAFVEAAAALRDSAARLLDDSLAEAARELADLRAVLADTTDAAASEAAAAVAVTCGLVERLTLASVGVAALAAEEAGRRAARLPLALALRELAASARQRS